MWEINTTPFITATPNRAIKPIPAEIEKGISRINKRNDPPDRHGHIQSRLRIAGLTALNAVNSKTKIRNSASGTTIMSRAARALQILELSPPLA